MSRAALLSLILASVALNAAAQLFLRVGARGGFPGEPGLMLVVQTALRPGILAGLACYALSILVWVYVLSRAEASFAYPFLGLGFVVVALAGWLFLGEALTPRRVAAILLIAAGVAVLAGS